MGTMEFLLIQDTLLTWMLPRSRVTLSLMFLFTLPESVLVAPLMDLDFLLESPRHSVLMITSSLSLVTETLLLLVWRETGPRDVVSSTMMPRPSSSGSMKRISLESSLCRRVVMSRESLRDLPEVLRLLETQSRRNLERTSVLMPSMDIFTLAQLILELE